MTDLHALIATWRAAKVRSRRVDINRAWKALSDELRRKGDDPLLWLAKDVAGLL